MAAEIIGRLRSFHLKQNLAHRPAGEVGEGVEKLGELEDAVHNGLGVDFPQKKKDLLPGGLAFWSTVSPDGDAADAEATEEKRSGVELWDGSGETADHGHFAVQAERVEHIVEALSPDVVDGEIDAPSEVGLELGGPLGDGGVEGGLGAEVDELLALLGLRERTTTEWPSARARWREARPTPPEAPVMRMRLGADRPIG